jgi:hypothetical protein
VGFGYNIAGLFASESTLFVWGGRLIDSAVAAAPTTAVSFGVESMLASVDVPRKNFDHPPFFAAPETVFDTDLKNDFFCFAVAGLSSSTSALGDVRTLYGGGGVAPGSSGPRESRLLLLLPWSMIARILGGSGCEW